MPRPGFMLRCGITRTAHCHGGCLFRVCLCVLTGHSYPSCSRYRATAWKPLTSALFAVLGMQLTVRHHEVRCSARCFRLTAVPDCVHAIVQGTSVYELTESSSSKCSLSDGGSPLAAAESVAYSPDGRWLALATASEVLIVDSVSRETVTAIPQAKVQAMHFSPRGTYLLTWHKPSDDEGACCA